MNAFIVQLPESLYERIRALADREGYSIDQFLASAAAEKLAALKTVDHLRRETSQASREDFERFLESVPPGKPTLETDLMPD